MSTVGRISLCHPPNEIITLILQLVYPQWYNSPSFWDKYEKVSASLPLEPIPEATQYGQ